jgi:cytochrome b involved in lipid metabolism
MSQSQEQKKLAFGFPFYPKQRDDKYLAKVTDWLEMKKQLDNVHFSPINEEILTKEKTKQPLWRIHDKLYDLTNFNHPGGQTFIEISQDTDITELFETSHYNIDKARALLDKYYVKDCHSNHQRYSSFFTFQQDGFYDRLRSKVNKIIQEQSLTKIEQQQYLWSSRFYHDMMLLSHLLLMIITVTAVNINAPLVRCTTVVAGIILGFLQVCAHNFFHKKDNWRMYTFDLTMTSSYEWRISHAYSHHNFANTIMDYEIQAFEPLVMYLPFASKNRVLYKISSMMSFLIVVPLVSTIQVNFFVSCWVPFLPLTFGYDFRCSIE